MTALAMIDLAGFRLGVPQRAGVLTVVPVFGPAYPGVLSPRDGVKLARVDGYGTVILRNPGSDGVAIVPLHIGYVQDGAQNHALCRSAFLAAGQELRFTDACCVQETTGGYLGERDQWFFTLPVELRAAALELRGEANYSKLWGAISRLNRGYGLPGRGHLESILARKRNVLTQFRSRLELVAEQLGALFFLGSRLVGAEIAPSPAYFADVWPALVCFAYGPAAMRREPVAESAVEPYAVSTLDELESARAADVAARADEVRGWIDAANWTAPAVTEEDRYLHMRLCTVDGERVAGQVVLADDRPVYASLFSKEIN
ncbi:ARPP-1 family domain-containing protein [Virgisporangium ochraceum]|uniref:ARG and Rhodanese-Phosphatase-superfamily-associated domain-containing protein n=1 Tax=Virgisporangium ochraceum TaxID=65505 RepID=A0A8J4ECS7_9ACTN|nr:DUF6569 family protein [Virgisporangium ochraceum]GIJ69823.1 hypothetical protein Voc01_047400 [Virgisporangium ochraceum]